MIEETAINLLKIIDDIFIYDYFINVSFYLDSDIEYFFEESTKIISQKSFSNIVDAIDGLMHYEAYNYWLCNKEIFDDVYIKGFVNAFIMDNLPFTKHELIKSLAEIAKTEAYEYLIKKQNELSIYSPTNSNIYNFISLLSRKILNSIYDYSSYYKINFLLKWFFLLNIRFEKSFYIDEKILLSILENSDIEESRSLFNFSYVQNSEEYNKFITKNKELIFSILKRKTDSLVIEEIDNNINIEYLIDNEKADKLNECSVDRINILNFRT